MKIMPLHEDEKKLRIAMIGHKRIPGREGGVEVVVEELSTRMAAAGHQVTVYNRAKRGFPKEREYKGVRIITVPTLNKKSLDALIYAFFASVHALFGHYDVIHYHSEGPCAMLFIPKIFGKRLVATIHGLDWQRAKWGGLGTRFLLLGERMAAKHADEVIVLSRNVQKYFMDKYRRDTHYIPNGVNEPVRREVNLIREKWGLEKDSYILFLARIVPEKGLHYLLEAFKGVKTDKKLVIAGDSSHTDGYLQTIKRMASEDPRVIMTSFVKGEALEELYSNCLLYVLPSDVEGMPLTLLEAMSYGCCCLVSSIDECMEVVEDRGVRFLKSEVPDLKAKLEMLSGNADAVEVYKKKAAVFVARKHCWDVVAEKTGYLYRM